MIFLALQFVKEFHVTIAWDLEQFGFRELPGEAKLAILKVSRI